MNRDGRPIVGVSPGGGPGKHPQRYLRLQVSARALVADSGGKAEGIEALTARQSKQRHFAFAALPAPLLAP
eukprot:CAMPEP_0172590234 /NCGR_PEP_ID=MMETSP1068-20121228/8682_1 /TAXON_ID=35684 /ORGANISM="Pseudopedinella elastica, Strain CCMP716" /LENGTH=70 /DNA_ID=CAMNT_0013385977 /DNA_START=329 /DNA_END=541 /DNA_ORIENTATION=-